MTNRNSIDDENGLGFVRLDECMGGDLDVVRSARVSFGRDADSFGYAEIALINFLMRERHGTPFEHIVFRFHVKCPLFVAREWFRHRIGSFNEFSARYSPVPNEFYVPHRDNVRAQIGKPGAYRFEPLGDEVSGQAIEIIENVNEHSYAAYRALIESGVAKELARAVLPVSMFTQFYWTVNARSLMNFLSLRTADTALLEIRKLAEIAEQHFAACMPITYSAWLDNEKMAP